MTGAQRVCMEPTTLEHTNIRIPHAECPWLQQVTEDPLSNWQVSVT